jgi:tRNA 2-thiocytidine biosynthesis protein TtcA
MTQYNERAMDQRPGNWNKIYSRALAAEKAFGMLQPGDRVLAGLSGGADSLVLLDLLAHQERTLGPKLGIRVIAGHVPGRYRGRAIAPPGRLLKICDGLGIELRIAARELTDETFKDCFICARARRRLLFDLAESCGCGKIALGHNADDMVETALLNILYAGRFAAIHPRQPLLGGRVTVIRPLALVWKEQITSYCRQRFGPSRRFNCPGSAASKRIMIRKLLARLERDGSPVKASILTAISNPKPGYLPRGNEAY